MGALAVVAFLGACDSKPPTAPADQALLEIVDPADAPAELVPGDFVVCKVGTDADFDYSIDFGTPISTLIADGECELIYQATTAGVGPEHVSVTENPIPAGYRLDRVEIWSVNWVAPGPVYETTMTTEYEATHAGYVDFEKIGCVLIYYNVPDFTNPGTGTPGYWAQHPEAWPVESIEIGGVTYTKAQAIMYMNMPVRGDKTLTMFPSLVSAKLNVIIGNDPSCVAGTITAADAWMTSYPVGSNVRGNSAAWDVGEPLNMTLDDYNNGLLCAPPRD
jgi:hypothetical protein